MDRSLSPKAEGKGSKPRKVAQFRQNSVVPGPSRCRDCKATTSRASSNSDTPSPRSRKIKSEGDKEDITVLVPVGCGENSTHTSWPSEKKKRRKRSAPTEGPVAASRSSAKRGREEEPLRQSRKRTGDAPQDLAPHPMETQARKRKREEECLESFASRYTLGDLLGTGGCGAVYAGVRDADGKQIAIKIVPRSDKEQFITVPGETRSLPLEVALMEMVCKPPHCEHIVELLEWFECEDCFILILERPIPCMDLFDFLVLHQFQLPEPQARLIMHQVVQAVLHCHDRGVLHRDVKAENLLVNTDTLNVKLIDFGCGDLLTTGPYRLFKGTKLFSPPEWLVDKTYEGCQATIWSLGVLLYILVCGAMPFETVEDIVEADLCFKGIPSRECSHLITWCLQKDPEKRPVLEDVLAHEWFLEGLQN
ncbi:serine/threonine-protein kinase pim-1-like isoform X1 [Brachyhypopomus gauderio]|uniref:serine/threonine-protein kinase pim-1-like isoform X1 n=1 Tax=Brachyhypopomus gauderio TaxID=698409 RepID=UPI004042F345